MNNLDLQYQHLLQDILLEGKEKTDRTGTGTKSVFGKQIRHKMSEGFPLLTTKKMAIKSIMTELKWFLKGKTNIKYLVENGCNIWNGDAYKRYKSVWDYDLDEPLSESDFIVKIIPIIIPNIVDKEPSEKPTRKKIDAAKQLSIKIFSEKEWYKLLNI